MLAWCRVELGFGGLAGRLIDVLEERLDEVGYQLLPRVVEALGLAFGVSFC